MTDPTGKSLAEWPPPLPGLGRVWACASQPGAPFEVAMVLLSAPGDAKGAGMATMYDPHEFRDLIRHLQAVADELTERNPR